MKLKDLHRIQALYESTRDFSRKLEAELGLHTFYAYDRGDDIVLDTIIVGKEHQGQGLGTRAMNALLNYADRSGKRIILTPGTVDDGHGTTSRSRLVKFYKRFGFVESKGRNIDYEIGAGKMYRYPLS